VAQDIDRKLRLTAALLGSIARKGLAAAFRHVNPNTSFDVGRADKWLQGRAQPRELSIYHDWAKVLGLERSGQWIADCDFDSFLDEVCARHGRDRADMMRQLEASAQGAARQGPGLSLAGTYVCYAHAWSPYFRGQLVRGELTIATAAGRSDRVSARYVEVLPTGRLQLDGVIAVDKRTLRIEVCDATRTAQYVNFSLFLPSPPVSVLGGLMFGTTLIGPDAQPSVTRAVVIRLASANARLRSDEAYLAPGVSLSGDLEALGLPIDDPVAVDDCLASFLGGSGRDGIDQVPAAAYRELIDLFDRIWLSAMRGDPHDGGARAAHVQHSGNVRPFPRRGLRRPKTAS